MMRNFVSKDADFQSCFSNIVEVRAKFIAASLYKESIKIQTAAGNECRLNGDLS